MSKQNILILSGLSVVVIVAGAVLTWHPWAHGGLSPAAPGPTPEVTTNNQPSGSLSVPAIPAVPASPSGVSANLSPTKLTIVTPSGTKPFTMSAEQITAVHRAAIDAAIAAESGATSSVPSNLSALSAPPSPVGQPQTRSGTNSATPQANAISPGTSAEYLKELAKTMGFVSLSTSYTALYGKTKVYFAAKGTPDAGNLGKISIFSYDPTTGVTQVAVLPDAGIQNVSDVALSPSEQYLVLFQCNPPASGIGCYRLSYGFVVFDLLAKTEVGSVGGPTATSSGTLYSFGQWSNDTNFSYRTYQPTTTNANSNVAIGNNLYAPSADSTFAIQ